MFGVDVSMSAGVLLSRGPCAAGSRCANSEALVADRHRLPRDHRTPLRSSSQAPPPAASVCGSPSTTLLHGTREPGSSASPSVPPIPAHRGAASWLARAALRLDPRLYRAAPRRPPCLRAPPRANGQHHRRSSSTWRTAGTTSLRRCCPSETRQRR
jgi:hypothetical protein